MRSKTTTATAPRIAVVLFIASLLISGCASTPTEEGPVRLVWPEPPDTARIEFVRTISSERDVGIDTTFSEKVVNFLGGQPVPPKHVAQPMGLAVSDDGQRVYVANIVAGVVFKFDFAQQGFQEIEGLHHPSGLALDAQERLYVVEQGKRRITVFNREGQRIGGITHPDIERPVGIAIDRQRQAGNLYVADTLNARVQQFDADGNYLRTFGERGNGYGMFERPKGVALDAFGNLYVVDTAWSNVQIFNPKGEVLLFFGGRGGYPGLLTNPTDIAIDPDNRIYVADHLSHRVNVYQLVNTRAEDSFPERVDGAAAEPTQARADKPMTGGQQGEDDETTDG
jgi:DNA-binding beta-propeller fold protein YncE